MKRGGKLWCFLSVIFIATLIIMITFFYGVTTVQTIKEVRKKPRASTFSRRGTVGY